jgi:hypothetical protein
VAGNIFKMIIHHLLVAMTEQKLKALKTICGAIHYTLRRYNRIEIGERDWNYLCSYLEIEKDAIYAIELSGTGFLFWSKSISFRFRDNQFHYQRRIEIQNLFDSNPVNADS